VASVAVIGAGFVGLSSAYWLMRDGHSVTLFDPAGPAGGASYGNAGTFANYACIPVNNPSVFRDFHRYLLAADSPFRLRATYLPRLMPWLARFLWHSTPTRYEVAVKALGQLLGRAYEGYADLVRDAGLEEQIRRRECLYLYSSERSFRNSADSLKLRLEAGVAYEILDASSIRELEPALAPIYSYGVLFPGSWHLSDPAGFLTALYGWLRGRGLRTETRAVTRLAPNDSGVVLFTPDGDESFEHAVVAAGIHSRSLAADCGDSLPLDTERGYHVTFGGVIDPIGRPCGWAERGLYMTPMAKGLRVAGTVELAGLDPRKSSDLMDLLARSARDALPALKEPGVRQTDEWLGFRPSFPDGLPVLGRSRASERVIYAFGHQHVGLTLGGLSGMVVAELLAGREPPLDLRAFDPRRF